MAKQQLYHVQDGYCTTTDGTTQTAMVSFNTATAAPGGGALNNCSIFVCGNSAGFDTTSNTACGERVAALFKIVSGTLTQVGSTVHVTSMIDDVPATPNTDFSISGTTITYYALGSTGETIQWLGRMEIHAYQPA